MRSSHSCSGEGNRSLGGMGRIAFRRTGSRRLLRKKKLSKSLQRPKTRVPPIRKRSRKQLKKFASTFRMGCTKRLARPMRKLERLKPEASLLSALRDEIEAGSAKAPTAEAEAIEEISVADIPAVPERRSLRLLPSPRLESWMHWSATWNPRSAMDSCRRQPPMRVAPASRSLNRKPAEVAAAATEHQPSGKLDSFVSDLEASLGDSFLAEAPVAKAEPRSKPRAVPETEPKPEPVAAKPDDGHRLPASSGSKVPAAMAAAAAQTGPAPRLRVLHRLSPITLRRFDP